MWKREPRQQKTEKSVRKPGGQLFRCCQGQIEWILGLFMILFLGILLCAQLQVEAYRAASLYLEDALAASNLASAVIDLEEYGVSHRVQIADFEQAYRRYCEALQGNLQLNEQWEGVNADLISGQITVERYIVYNRSIEGIRVYERDNTGKISSWQGVPGTVRAPNGLLIENTSVYSEISFPVEGSFGVRVVAHKGKLVDIVSLEEEIAVSSETIQDQTDPIE